MADNARIDEMLSRIYAQARRDGFSVRAANAVSALVVTSEYQPKMRARLLAIIEQEI